MKYHENAEDLLWSLDQYKGMFDVKSTPICAQMAIEDAAVLIQELQAERDYIIGRRQYWEAEALKEHLRAESLAAEIEVLKAEKEAFHLARSLGY